MYLWNTKALAKELKEGTLSESQKFKYYITVTLLFYLFTMLPGSKESSIILYSFLGMLVSLLIIFFGIYKCYQVNKSGDNVNFIERFICLSLPVGIRVCAFSILLLVISIFLTFLLGFFGILSSESTNLISILPLVILALVIVIYLSFYWRIYVHIKWISHNNTDMINS